MNGEFGKTIMVVDDSILICEQIKTVMANEPVFICEAHSGEEALDVIRQFNPDLILLDVVLPDIGGYELYEKLKGVDQNNAVIVFLTSLDSDEDVVKGFSMGASDYIKKPFHGAELKSRVITHLMLKKEKDELNKQNNELRNNMEKLNYLAFRDGLTGLYNRRYVVDDLMEEMRCHGRADVENVLIMADVDNFKIINDTYGHDAGDVALICISNIMENICRRHKVVRWGGEEFLIILFAVTKEEADQISEQIRSEIEVFTIVHGDIQFQCTITLGLNAYCEDENIKVNIDKADKALYAGKRSGKNRSVWYQEIENMEIEDGVL